MISDRMYRQPVLIYNPYAGKIRRNRERILQRTIAALGRAGMTPRVLPTDAAGHATELARTAITEGADLVLALGGDGTLNEAANGMAHSGVPLGVLPAGTANVLANELGLGSRPDGAAEKLAKCEPRSVAMGRMTTADGVSRYFLCMAGAGLDAKIVREVSSGLKDRTGKVAYWAAGLAQFPHRVEQLEVRVRGKVYRCGFALVSRVRNYGGDLEIASGASLLREDFEVVLFESANPLRYAWYMFGVGLRRVQRMQGVQTLSAQCAEILCSTDLQMDGEYAGRQTAKLETVPQALTLLIPSVYG
jgi:diacylglycerol kinase (ATP)